MIIARLGSPVCLTTGAPAQLVLCGSEESGIATSQNQTLPVDAAIVAIIDEIDFAR